MPPPSQPPQSSASWKLRGLSRTSARLHSVKLVRRSVGASSSAGTPCPVGTLRSVGAPSRRNCATLSGGASCGRRGPTSVGDDGELSDQCCPPGMAPCARASSLSVLEKLQSTLPGDTFGTQSTLLGAAFAARSTSPSALATRFTRAVAFAAWSRPVGVSSAVQCTLSGAASAALSTLSGAASAAWSTPRPRPPIEWQSAACHARATSTVSNPIVTVV
mmetsp:Transcript_2022/g.5297  ORF Transcript_2022/g.5297 Transcript_2022/m.5297 type:complete len:218 (-) Transcript_2022:356-1009(-)